MARTSYRAGIQSLDWATAVGVSQLPHRIFLRLALVVRTKSQLSRNPHRRLNSLGFDPVTFPVSESMR